eukprot:4137006-Alexandrium_andersonii.AAC.1
MPHVCRHVGGAWVAARQATEGPPRNHQGTHWGAEAPPWGAERRRGAGPSRSPPMVQQQLCRTHLTQF